MDKLDLKLVVLMLVLMVFVISCLIFNIRDLLVLHKINKELDEEKIEIDQFYEEARKRVEESEDGREN